MHNDLLLYFSVMKPTLLLVCGRYEIRAPMSHLPMIRHSFAEHSIRYCLINLLNKDTRFTSIMERVDSHWIQTPAACPGIRKGGGPQNLKFFFCFLIFQGGPS